MRLFRRKHKPPTPGAVIVVDADAIESLHMDNTTHSRPPLDSLEYLAYGHTVPVLSARVVFKTNEGNTIELEAIKPTITIHVPSDTAEDAA